MAVSQAEVGRRIRAARGACGSTQEQVAAALGLSRSSLAQIELGHRAVSSLELEQLAHVFGRDMREFVREDAFREDDPLVALLRAQPEAASDEVVEALRACLALGREVTHLERLLQIERAGAVVTYPLAKPKSRWDAVEQGTWLADEERRRLDLGAAPVGDLVDLLETQGMRTALVALPPDVSGLTLNAEALGVLVVANRTHHFWRRRFAFAHEYAHVLVDRARLASVSRDADQEQLPEVRANAFAAAFLMPERGVREFLAGLGKGHASRGYAEVFSHGAALVAEGRLPPRSQDVQIYDVVQVAHHFGVSRLASLYRLKNLRLLSAAEFERLKARDDAGRGAEVARLLGLPEPDPEASRREFAHRVAGLGLEAFRRELISLAKLHEVAGRVGLERDAVDDLLAEVGLFEATAG